MTPSIWETIADIPWWIYLLVTYFIVLSYSATKAQFINTKNLFAFAFVFTTFSFITLWYTKHLSMLGLFIWLAGIVPGIAIGWMQFFIRRVKAIRDESLLYVPGSWLIFIVVLGFAGLSYYLRMKFSTEMFYTFSQGKYAGYLVLLYGVCTGMIIGRLIYAMRCLKTGPYITKPA